MSAVPIDPQAVIRQLEKLLASPHFARSERLSKLLRFLVERRIEGREGELKESLLGVEVYGRAPDYNPKVDSTVRSEAARVRRRLGNYYDREGAWDTVLIQLPKGGYVPTFQERNLTSAPSRIRHGSRRWSLGVVVLACAVMLASGWWSLKKSSPIRIAVLPLINVSQDAANEYLADGLTCETISELSLIEGLTVRSQTSSFALKGTRGNAREVGNRLAVDYILEGSLVVGGPQLHINARLVRTRDDVPMWSGRFDHPTTDLLAIQEDISLGIVNSLRLKLGHGRRRYETSAAAYDLYLRARAVEAGRFRGDGDTIDLFEKAIARDPALAPAYAGLAGAYAFRSFSAPEADRPEYVARMRAAAEKAIQLDPLLAEAHSALGTAYARIGQWQQAEVSLRRAIQIDPNLAFVHDNLSWFFLFPLGRIDEAIKEARTEVALDPLSPWAHYLLAETLISAGRYDAAASECTSLSAGFPFYGDCLGRTLQGQGRTEDAVRVLATANSWGYLAYAYAKTGRQAEAEKLMAEAPARYPNRHGHFQYALAFAGFGDRDRTIEHLESWSVGPVRVGFTLTGPEFAFLRGDPRVSALRKKVGLPE